jgi:shikimate dehydrogenase
MAFATRASITGHTRVIVILAHPVGHIRTPAAMNAHFAATGQDAVIVPMHVLPDDLPAVVDGLRRLRNLGGIIVTVPHKETIARLCDRLTRQASLVGAVNAIRREADGTLLGGQFDGEGYVAGLHAAGHIVAGRRVWMAGAGGAAAGVGFALLRHGAAALGVHNRGTARAEALVARLRGAFPDRDIAAIGADPAGFDIVVNATSLGSTATTGSFTSPLTALTASTLYHTRAYALLSDGSVAYGTDTSFTTLASDPPDALFSLAMMTSRMWPTRIVFRLEKRAGSCLIRSPSAMINS